jgi:hemoglobin
MAHLPIVGDPSRDDAPVSRPSGATIAEGVPHPDLRDDDLHDLLVAFYDSVGADPMLAPYFHELDMQAHIPRIADFWSTLVFGTRRYSGNAFRPHAGMPGLTGPHFARWLETLERTIDARFAGPHAEQMKALGHRVAFSMQIRLGIAPFEDAPAA